MGAACEPLKDFLETAYKMIESLLSRVLLAVGRFEDGTCRQRLSICVAQQRSPNLAYGFVVFVPCAKIVKALKAKHAHTLEVVVDRFQHRGILRKNVFQFLKYAIVCDFIRVQKSKNEKMSNKMKIDMHDQYFFPFF